jgi:hypothetical protein
MLSDLLLCLRLGQAVRKFEKSRPGNRPANAAIGRRRAPQHAAWSRASLSPAGLSSAPARPSNGNCRDKSTRMSSDAVWRGSIREDLIEAGFESRSGMWANWRIASYSRNGHTQRGDTCSARPSAWRLRAEPRRRPACATLRHANANLATPRWPANSSTTPMRRLARPTM